MSAAPSRRAVLGWLGAGVALGGCRVPLDAPPGAPREDSPVSPTPVSSARMPVAFVGHGSPMLALDPVKGADLRRFAESLPRPRAILAVSAHFERAPVTIGATREVPLVYDFGGFPATLYRLTYRAPPAPDLATRVETLLRPLGPVARAEGRGHDHGVWVPLRCLYPDADLPLLSLSLPTPSPSSHLALGRALAPLRDEGVLLLGSGNLVHNLRRLSRDDASPPPAWAREFDDWIASSLSRRDLDALADWERRAPAARTAHPTAEHFLPILLAVGAAPDAPVSFPVSGFEAGSISRRCVRLG